MVPQSDNMPPLEIIDVDDPDIVYTHCITRKPPPPPRTRETFIVRPADPSQCLPARTARVVEILSSGSEEEEEGGRAKRSTAPKAKARPTDITIGHPSTSGPSPKKKRRLGADGRPARTLGGNDDDGFYLPIKRPDTSRADPKPVFAPPNMQTVQSSRPRRPPQVVVIDLTEDDAEVEVGGGLLPDGPGTEIETQQQQREEPGSDYEYDSVHAALDINDPSNWSNELPERDVEEAGLGNRTQALEAAGAEASQAARSALGTHLKTRRTSVPAWFASRTAWDPAWSQMSAGGHKYSWAGIQKALRGSTSIAASQRTREVHGSMARFRHLGETVYKHLTPGPINTVAQRDGMVAVASCVLGDTADPNGARHYSQEASLKLLYKDRVLALPGHVRGSPAHEVAYRTVNEAQFDPGSDLYPHRLVSCGRDGKVIQWDCSDVVGEDGKDGVPEIIKEFQYPDERIPLGVLFKPEGETFVVWDSEGCLRVHKNDIKFTGLDVTPPTDVQPVQSVGWGRGASQDLLFATSGSDYWQKKCGYHKIFEIREKQKVSRTIDNPDSGECLDIDPRGNEVALVTCNETQRFRMSIYDLRTKTHGMQARHVDLDPLPTWVEDTEENHRSPAVNTVPSSINQVLYSPDGIFLAVARSDNAVHVYDSRFLGRVLYQFRHRPGVEGQVDDTKFGIYKIEWLVNPATNRLSIVSGGSDGCVRLWDVTAGRTRSRYGDGPVLAQTEAYVGWFSLGDVTKREVPLVVGDGGGTLVIRQ